MWMGSRHATDDADCFTKSWMLLRAFRIILPQVSRNLGLKWSFWVVPLHKSGSEHWDCCSNLSACTEVSRSRSWIKIPTKIYFRSALILSFLTSSSAVGACDKCGYMILTNNPDAFLLSLQKPFHCRLKHLSFRMQLLVMSALYCSCLHGC